MTINPWDVAPLADKGDDTAATIHQAVGLALSQWAMLEDFLARLFAMLVGSRFESAEAAYSQIINVGTRNTMILEAAKRVMLPPSALTSELKTLLSQIGNMAGRRNDIAHGVVCDFQLTTPAGLYLTPSGTDYRKTNHNPIYQPRPALPTPFRFYAYAYTSAQIVGYTIHFQEYLLKTVDLTRRIEAHYARRLGRP